MVEVFSRLSRNLKDLEDTLYDDASEATYPILHQVQDENAETLEQEEDAETLELVSVAPPLTLNPEGEPDSDIEDQVRSFLVMREYGRWNVRVDEDMRHLGALIYAIAT
ncbi:hypothetical protein B7463_g4165, partial [Scytalidium lignicola]